MYLAHVSRQIVLSYTILEFSLFFPQLFVEVCRNLPEMPACSSVGLINSYTTVTQVNCAVFTSATNSPEVAHFEQ